MNFLILGASYTGCYAYVNFSKEHEFYFLSRSYINKINDNIKLNKFNINVNHIDTIIDTIPPISVEDNLSENYFPYQSIVEKLINKNLSNSKKINYIYISSTSVFQNYDELENFDNTIKIFDENSIPNAISKKGVARLKNEKKILSLYPFAKILRSTGIYGPGRSLVTQIKNKNFQRISLGNIYTSRIHVHDLLRLCFALSGNIKEKNNIKLVHAVDQNTASYSEVLDYIKNELKIEIPFEFNENSKPKGRIIKSLYALDLLDNKFTYPTYKEGFNNCI